jgi:hypothetical protein
MLGIASVDRRVQGLNQNPTTNQHCATSASPDAIIPASAIARAGAR